MDYHVYSGQVVNGIVLSTDNMYVHWNGLAKYTIVEDIGKLFILSGGVASSTLVSNGGCVYVSVGGKANSSNGGVASSTIVGSDGKLYASDGGVVCETTVNSGGSVVIYDGGVAKSATINTGAGALVENGGMFSSAILSGGNFTISSGGVASSVAMRSGTIHVGSEGKISGIVMSHGCMYVSGGAFANVASLGAGGSVYISSGGGLTRGTIGFGGSMHVHSDGHADSVTVNSGGSLSIAGSGSVLNIRESGGYVGVDSNAASSFVSNVIIGRNLTQEEITRLGFANLEKVFIGTGFNWNATVHSGTTAWFVSVVNNGSLFVYSGGLFASGSVINGGCLHVSNGGIADRAAVSRGLMYVSSGGMANYATVTDFGYMYISGGMANYAVINGSGTLRVEDSGTADFTTVAADGQMIVESGTVNSTTIRSDGWAYLSSGGVANATVINSYGRLFVSGEGFANSTTVNGFGRLYVFSGGSADATTVNSSGRAYVSNGGVANATVIVSDGWMQVYSGGIARSMTVSAGGSLTVESGGAAVSAAATNEGEIWVHSGGELISATAQSRGRINIGSGGKTGEITVERDGLLNVGGGGAADEIVLRGGDLVVSSGGTATLTFDPWRTGTISSCEGAKVTHLGREAAVYYGSYETGVISKSDVFDNLTVNDREEVFVYSGGVVNSMLAASGGEVCIYSGGNIGSATVESGGRINVSRSGVADEVTLRGGTLVVSYGGTAALAFDPWRIGIISTYDGATVNYLDRDAAVYYGSYETGVISKADVFNNLTVNGHEEILVYSDGVADSMMATGGGEVRIYDGGNVRTATVANGGRFNVSSGGAADSITATVGGEIRVYDGGDLKTITIESGGRLDVSSGGAADAVTLKGGDLVVSWGGTAALTFDPWRIGTISSYGGATVNYLDRDASVYYGSFETGIISSADVFYGLTVNDHEEVFVYSGGVVNSMLATSGGDIRIYDGGDLKTITIESGGRLDVGSGGVADAVTLKGGDLVVSSGGTAALAFDPWRIGTISSCGGATVTFLEGDAKVYYGSGSTTSKGDCFSGLAVGADYDLFVYSGGTADSTTVNSNGRAYVSSGGVANTVTVEADGKVTVCSGGKITGRITIAQSDAFVFVSQGGNIDFDISAHTPDEAPLVNNLSLVQGAPDYTMTVSATQKIGNYVLARGAMGFDRTITVGTSNGKEIGVLTVGGKLVAENYTYWLEIASGGLLLTVTPVDTEPPAKPIAQADSTAPTTRNVTVTATFSDASVVKEYSFDSLTWQPYTGPVVMTENGAVYFRGTDPAGNVSEVTEYDVTNIDRVPPQKPVVSADITAPTNRNVAVGASYSDDSVVREYTLDGKSWLGYTGAVVMTGNGTVCFRGIDVVGNISEIAEYTVSNIDRVSPEAPKASADIVKPTCNPVTVTAYFSGDSVTKEYSLDGEKWFIYTQEIVFAENGKVSFRGTDAAGNVSAVTEYHVGNIATGENIFSALLGYDGVYQQSFTPTISESGWYTVNGDFGVFSGSLTIFDNDRKVASATIKNGVLKFNRNRAALLDKNKSYTVVIKTADKKSAGAEFLWTLNATDLFTKGDNSDDTKAKAKTLAAGSPANDWVGYGDAVDCWKLGIDARGGFYDLSISGVRNNVKLTVFAADGRKVKGVTVSAKKPAAALANLCLANGSYAVVEAPKAAKAQNSEYTLKLTQKAVFTGAKNNDWNNAQVLKNGATFTGALTKAAGGDTVDYCDVSKIDALTFDMTAGKTKVSFFDAQHNAVKAALKLANGADKTAASLTLAAGDAATDHFTISAIDDAVKYLKIEAAGKTLNGYTITKIA